MDTGKSSFYVVVYSLVMLYMEIGMLSESSLIYLLNLHWSTYYFIHIFSGHVIYLVCYLHLNLSWYIPGIILWQMQCTNHCTSIRKCASSFPQYYNMLLCILHNALQSNRHRNRFIDFGVTFFQKISKWQFIPLFLGKSSPN